MVKHRPNVLSTIKQDLPGLSSTISELEAKDDGSHELKSLRASWGIYEQRRSGLFMFRVRIPAGEIRPEQMKGLARIAEAHGSGRLHLTTRQDIQVHDIPPERIIPSLEMLAEYGLTTKGGGGNTLRNITSCPYAGLCPNEQFDVTQSAKALTDSLLERPDSFQLPRKYKIAFAGCSEDCAGAIANDLGFIARTKDGEEGFAAYVGGGMGSRSRIGDLLEPFVPATEIHHVAEAVKRVFHEHGDRENRSKARLRFLIERIGLDEFKRLYRAQLNCVRKEPARPLPAPTGESVTLSDDGEPSHERYFSQKQKDLFAIHVGLFLGDISSAALSRLAEVVERHGAGLARITQRQNFLIPSVHRSEREGILRELDEVPRDDPNFCNSTLIRNIVSCIGAETCRIGICDSQRIARRIRDALENSHFSTCGDGVAISVSGCPNCCGRHLLSDIALSGKKKKVAGQSVEFYTVATGGRTGEGQTAFATDGVDVPAVEVPAYVHRLFAER